MKQLIDLLNANQNVSITLTINDGELFMIVANDQFEASELMKMDDVIGDEDFIIEILKTGIEINSIDESDFDDDLELLDNGIN